MSPIGSLFRIALVSYFAFVLFRAVKKLKSRDVGTMFSIKDEETVQVSDSYSVLLVRVGTKDPLLLPFVWTFLQSLYLLSSSRTRFCLHVT